MHPSWLSEHPSRGTSPGCMICTPSMLTGGWTSRSCMMIEPGLAWLLDQQGTQTATSLCHTPAHSCPHQAPCLLTVTLHNRQRCVALPLVLRVGVHEHFSFANALQQPGFTVLQQASHMSAPTVQRKVSSLRLGPHGNMFVSGKGGTDWSAHRHRSRSMACFSPVLFCAVPRLYSLLPKVWNIESCVYPKSDTRVHASPHMRRTYLQSCGWGSAPSGSYQASPMGDSAHPGTLCEWLARVPSSLPNTPRSNQSSQVCPSEHQSSHQPLSVVDPPGPQILSQPGIFCPHFLGFRK